MRVLPVLKDNISRGTLNPFVCVRRCGAMATSSGFLNLLQAHLPSPTMRSIKHRIAPGLIGDEASRWAIFLDKSMS